ncbi:peptidase family C78-domain-containing protein [Paraphoma chrysanthemicola]|uniref:Peptidase family C78-domain-containing protein n=1 Tax=Paraphoma chrysanthemicola TaxID=798071 RepID=A0A8K0VZ13_9PLEO|nr:peptidase family C78-domain-containing protein [Paraphoma chrysanthemicola]
MDVLACPMCDFTIDSHDDYGPELLQLHFEQVHTTDSPFRVVEDAESPPPTLPPRPSSKRKHVDDTPSSDDEENTVTCSEPDCGEVVLLIDLNEHLDYHAAETLSFDETTGKYHSHHLSATMQGLKTPHPHEDYSKGLYHDHSFTTDLHDALKRHDGHGHKLKKHGHRDRSNTATSEKSTLSRSILSFNPFAKLDKTVKPPNKSARLGKSELGPYAWEERMPRWLHDQLAAGPKINIVNRIGRDGRLIKQEQVQNETPGIIPILAQLSALDRNVTEAYYCHPSTLHVGKTPREGGFCGYRNIQMLLSYIQGAKAQGHEEFPGRTPGILVLQDLIETAWDKGINQIGRVQTGGIRDTRKYIGTPEAQAFFLSSEINCAVEMFSDSKERKIEAHETLLDAIERYFAQAAVKDGSNVYKTLLPPIYLQQPGHSITIVGLERRRDGACNLVVLDPMYSTSPVMHKLLGRKNIRTARPEVMHAYRRGARQLRKHAAFEILMLTATPPLFPAWDVLRQFPDCRFVYAFFRSRTLGYDVYPEDYFLPNFPWQQYGGLWICDEARFARSEPINALNAQALRRITAEGASTRSSSSNSPTSSFTNNTFSHLPVADGHMRGEAYTQLPSFVPSLDGSPKPSVPMPQRSGCGPVYNMGRLSATLPIPEAARPTLSLLTDVGRKYPGFPTPLSPTPSAKDLYPSPASEIGSDATTPRPNSPVVCSISPMSIDGSEMCGPSHRCQSHGFEHYMSNIGLIDNIIAHSKASDGGFQSPKSYKDSPSPSSCSQSPISPTIPLRVVSPRTAMLKSIVDKQAFQDLSHNPMGSSHPKLELHPRTINAPYAFPVSPSCSSSPRNANQSPPSISIANGTETALTSPISPTGTVLAYTSHRPVDSGLLGVRPLSEAQVAEYRFWRPCGKRVCAFGCGIAHNGEWMAAKRLFKDAEEVDESMRRGFGCDGQGEEPVEEAEEEESYKSSVWAGRTLVTNWPRFLGQCEREGVARF